MSVPFYTPLAHFKSLITRSDAKQVLLVTPSITQGLSEYEIYTAKLFYCLAGEVDRRGLIHLKSGIVDGDNLKSYQESLLI